MGHWQAGPQLLLLAVAVAFSSSQGVAGCMDGKCIFGVVPESPMPSPQPSPRPSPAPSPAPMITPLVSSQCEWPVGGWPPECKPTHAAMLQAGTVLVNATAYAARAVAFLTAASLQCKQFEQTECHWPCSYNGEQCDVFSAYAFNVWDCPGTKADMRVQCNLPRNNDTATCNATKGCQWCTGGEYGRGSCEASFFANMTEDGRLDWMSLYFAQMPKEFVGCCKGSNYRWAREQACRVEAIGPLARAECRRRPGCEWSVSQGLCLPSDTYLINLMFADNPLHPLARTLTNMAKECKRITNASLCSNHKPVVIDRIKLAFYMNQNLRGLNTRVAAAQCKVRPLKRDLVQYNQLPGEGQVDAGPQISDKGQKQGPGSWTAGGQQQQQQPGGAGGGRGGVYKSFGGGPGGGRP